MASTDTTQTTTSTSNPTSAPPALSVNTSTTATSPPAYSPAPPSPPPHITYVIKRITFNGKRVPIACQNTNGPCPLLALANILSLRGHFTIHEDKSVATADELLAAVSDYLFDSASNSANSEGLQRNHEKNVSDVIQMLPHTLVGIDVNLKFDTITSFEFNSDMLLFDFCNMRLVHGWLVDPQDTMYAFIRPLSYNQLVEKELERISSTGMRSPPRTKLFVGSPKIGSLSLRSEDSVGNIAGPSAIHTSDVIPVNHDVTINHQPSPRLTTTSTSTTTTTTTTSGSEQASGSSAVDKETQGLLVSQFLNDTATQLTYHGLTELHTGLRDEELCVFFRNNHFNTLYKHNGELFVLVTDQGYASEPLVWEKLCQIDGDSTFLRSDFTTYHATSSIVGLEEPSSPQREIEDRDLALAMQLQDEENKRNPPKIKDKDKDKSHGEEKNGKHKKEHCIVM